jgi:hypothetical protein
VSVFLSVCVFVCVFGMPCEFMLALYRPVPLYVCLSVFISLTLSSVRVSLASILFLSLFNSICSSICLYPSAFSSFFLIFFFPSVSPSLSLPYICLSNSLCGVINVQDRGTVQSLSRSLLCFHRQSVPHSYRL